MSAVNLELLPLQAYTVGAAGGAIDVAGLKELWVTVRLTTGSGTLGNFSVYLEGTDDEGTTWYELVADTVLKNNGAADDPTTNVDKRNIVDNETTIITTETKWTAQYTRFPDKVRARWILSGGASPSETFGVKAVGKN